MLSMLNFMLVQLAAFFIISFLPQVNSFNLTPVSSVNLDLNDLGRVSLVGDFDSISLYQYEGQNDLSVVSNGAQSLLAQLPDYSFAPLAISDGYIMDICFFVSEDGELETVVVGGNFTSLSSVEAQGIAFFDPATSEITSENGISGGITSLYCDNDSGVVYAGGSFVYRESSNALAWSTNWMELPFSGFNGKVLSIAKASNGNIVFGGLFDGLGNYSSPYMKHRQAIPLPSASISATSSTTRTGFSDPRNIICNTADQDDEGNTWLLADGATGTWEADFSFGFRPTKLRLYNTQIEGRGTKSWAFTALPLGGIMNFTYTNTDGETEFCDATCSLPENNSTFQDFVFVNNVGMDGFRIDIWDWYGSGGGLSGIALFHDDIFSYAVSEFNQYDCGGGSSEGSSTSTGPWETASSGVSVSDYLTATLTDSDLQSDTVSVTFQPYIEQSGNYSVTMYTPGCISDGTCATRGRALVTGELTSPSNNEDSEGFEIEIFQTNNYDKYDQIYLGYVEASQDSFQPSITLSPISGQTGPITLVAQRVGFELIQFNGGLNGLYEYDPDSSANILDFSDSAIIEAGNRLNENAMITGMVVVADGTLIVSGSFSGEDFGNVFSVQNEEMASLSGGGLNGDVLAMYLYNSDLYLGGNFVATADGGVEGLNGVALYSIDNDSWQSLGAGVDGEVVNIIPLNVSLSDDTIETALSVSGSFNQIKAFDDNDAVSVEGVATWIPSRNIWLENLDSVTSLNGALSAHANVPGYSSIYAGSAASQAIDATGVVGLHLPEDLELYSMPFEVQLTSNEKATGPVVGLMFNEDNHNLTIIGGHFTAMATNGSEIHNLLFLDGSDSNTVSGISNGMDNVSVIFAMDTSDTILFAGGSISGNINGNDINGLISYDLSTGDFANNQPSLSGDDIVVNAIATQPDTSNIYVGGNFELAGTLSCPSLCIFDLSRVQWNSPGSGVTGTVFALIWISENELLIGGDLEVNGEATKIATYNAESHEYTIFPKASDIPGPVTVICAANSGKSEFWVGGTISDDGKPFIQRYDGNDWLSASEGLGNGTIIRDLQVFTLVDDHESSTLLNKNEGLLVLGQIYLSGFGSASGVIFNGTNFSPYILSASGNSAGSLSLAFVEYPQNFFSSEDDHLALGFVVLIALAISLALIFIIVVIGILAERFRRKRDGYVPAPTQIDKVPNMNRIPPEHLFGDIGSMQRR